MKKFKLYITAVLAAVLFAVGCDKDFDEMNVDPLNPTMIEPTYLLNTAIDNLAQTTGDALSQFYMITQMFVTPFGGDLQGANYNQWHNRQNTRWQTLYPTAIRYLTVVVDVTKGDPTKANLYNAARIWRAYAFQQLTDTYGDIPYTEAGLGNPKGFLNYEGGINEKPRYDTQRDIYMDLLIELDEASAALNADQAFPNEILFGVGGATNTNVTKWKRFGYSMLLRTAMRLSNVDPGKAEEYVKKAVAGGLMQSNADNAKYNHTAEFANSVGNQITASERANYYVTDVYVNFLRSKSDPRLRALTHRYVGAGSSADHVASNRTKDPAQMIGMPVGYNQISIAERVVIDGVGTERGHMYAYSSFDNVDVYSRFMPEWHCNYGQTQLLLAEAIARGWVTDQGTAAAAYERGIRANMELLAEVSAVIPEADINAYIAANPLDMSTLTLEAALELINYEYWVGSLPTAPAIEGWANWRRSGYPVLKPNEYPASEIPGEFIRRHKYPDRENITNRENFLEAIGRSPLNGVDAMDAKGWWDKK